MTGRGLVILAALTALVAFAEADAETRLGGQRAGTSSATFLKIAVDPRAAALGGASVAVAEGIASLSTNPACLTTLRDPEVMFAYVEWPGDVDYTYFAVGNHSLRLRGTIGLQLGYLGTVMEETTEERPYGTGRNFGFRDWFLGVSYARQFTDNLSFGITGRYVREDLATEVGGPSMHNWLLDAGTLYFIDFLQTRLAFAIQSFGPEFEPSGDYISNITDAPTSYQAFAPPTVFRLGVGATPVTKDEYTLSTTLEMNNYSDSPETIKMGTEFSYQGKYHLRAGYDVYADAMKLSLGIGVHTQFGFSEGDVDYAFTDAGPLGEVHRFAIRLTF